MPNQILRLETADIEKSHLQFCKRYLEVDNNGRLPLKITINHKILNYILYIKSKDEKSFVKQAF